MKSLLNFRLFFFTIIVATTIAIKIRYQNVGGEDVGNAQSLIANFLEVNQFVIEKSLRRSEGGPQIYASLDQCEIVIRAVSAQGWHQAELQMLAHDRKLIFITGGEFYFGAQPVWKTWFELRWQRLLLSFGIETKPVYVFGVILSDYCDGINIDWSVLRVPVVAP